MYMYLHRLRLIEEEFCADLLADDLSAYVVLLCQAESHLLQDELHFLVTLHGTKRLYLHVHVAQGERRGKRNREHCVWIYRLSVYIHMYIDVHVQ